MSETMKNAPVQKGQSTIAYRIIAAIVAIACAAAFFLPFTIFAGHPLMPGLVTAEKKLYELFELMPDAPFKLFGFIPMFANPDGVLGLASGLVTYVLIASLAIAFVLAVLAVIIGKKSEMLAFLATIVFTWGAALYMIAVVSISCYLPMKIIFDTSAILMAALGTIAFFAIMFAKLGKLSLLNGVRFLLTLGFTVCLFLSLTYNYDLVQDLMAEKKFYKLFLVIAIALTLVNVIFASVRAFKKKAFSFDFINAVAELIIAGVLIILSVTSPVTDKALLLLSSIAAGIAVILFVLTFIGVKVSQRKAAARAAAQAEAEAAAKKAESAPATAKEEPKAAASVAAAAPVVSTVEDYFAGKKIDKFISTLNVAERNAFASLYLLRHKDIMPEIPAYEIGGDNRNFFELAFITLGEYRDEIPDSLLAKMYNHMCVEYPQSEIPEVEDAE